MRVFKNGAPAGTAADIDLREGTGISLTVSDESGANGATAVTIANSGSQPAVILSTGPTDPTTSASPVPSGDEYVWIKTDGSGNLIDIISGKAA